MASPAATALFGCGLAESASLTKIKGRESPMEVTSFRNSVSNIFHKTPRYQTLNYGEVNAVWSYLAYAKGALVEFQTYMNHAQDKLLKKFLRDAMDNSIKVICQQFENILKANGVVLPPSPSEKPEVPAASIPDGARLTDPEIAAAISRNIAFNLVTVSQILPLCTTEDLALTFSNILVAETQYGAKIFGIRKKKGWLLCPPLHHADTL